MTESLSLRSELQELQICQLKTTGNFEAELIIWTTNTRNYRDIMQSVCVSFWNYTKSTERGQSTQRKLKQVNWKHHYSSSGVKEEQTHLAVPWDAQNHPFLLIIQLWIIASQTFPYCSAAHCFLQLSLSPATTLPPIPGIAKAIYCQLCHSRTLDDPTPEDGKHTNHIMLLDFSLLLHCKTLLYSFLPLSCSPSVEEKKKISHQHLLVTHVHRGELTCKELSCLLARRPTLLSACFILIEPDSPELY